MALAARALRAAPAAAIALASLTSPVPLGFGSAASAQAVVRDVPLGRFVAYGLDGTHLRVVRVRRVDRIDGRAYVRDHRATSGAAAYLIVSLEVRNPGAAAVNIPLLQVAVVTDDGRTIDPAVYGPFVGASEVAAPTSTTVAPKRTISVTLAVADVPDGHAVAQLIFNPNDATPAYRVRLRPGDVPTLPERARS